MLRPKLHDVVVEAGEPPAQWRIVDHWRDVFVLERLGEIHARRFVYEDDLLDRSRYRAVAR